MWLLLITLLSSHVASYGNSIGYSGYKVVRFLPQTQDEVHTLQELLTSSYLDFWREPSVPGHPVDVMFGPDDVTSLDVTITSGISHETYIPDVERLIEEASTAQKELPSDRLPSYRYDTDRFYNLSEIYDFLDSVNVVCGANCELITIGQSYEGRDIKLIKITRPGTTRRAIWLDGGIHAREWLTPAVSSYFIDKLVNEDGIDPDVQDMRDSFDWYIQPVVNVDGYDYTWTDNSTRLWRKTRSENINSTCLGTDPNRNYNIGWGVEPGSEGDPCSNIYRGSGPESEAVIAAQTAFIRTVSSSIDLLNSFHTYGQILLMPWGYTSDDPEDLDDLVRLADLSVNAINNFNADTNITYEHGRAVAAGVTFDWAKGEAGIKHTYSMEMRDHGDYGFLAPPSEILPTCEENWVGVRTMAIELSYAQCK